ncbi:uncharacterized protein ACOB8E_011233 [Sarcophilus harrisii]
MESAGRATQGEGAGRPEGCRANVPTRHPPAPLGGFSHRASASHRGRLGVAGLGLRGSSGAPILCLHLHPRTRALTPPSRGDGPRVPAGTSPNSAQVHVGGVQERVRPGRSEGNCLSPPLLPRPSASVPLRLPKTDTLRTFLRPPAPSPRPLVFSVLSLQRAGQAQPGPEAATAAEDSAGAARIPPRCRRRRRRRAPHPAAPALLLSCAAAQLRCCSGDASDRERGGGAGDGGGRGRRWSWTRGGGAELREPPTASSSPRTHGPGVAAVLGSSL